MPYVHVQITREGGTSAKQKADVIAGMTRVLEEVELENWGIGGLPVAEYRRAQANGS